jgi:hypothetical protein
VSAPANLLRVVRTDPPGAPLVTSQLDASTQLPVTQVLRVSPGEIDITFNEPIDSSTLSTASIAVEDLSRGTDISGLTFGYFNVTAPDGSVQGVIRIFSALNFGGATSVKITLQGGVNSNSIADRTGLRSALFDYNQDGVPDVQGDPFGTTIGAGQSFTILGIPTNDDFANAIGLSGSPLNVTGNNSNATLQISEPITGAGFTVWWNWTATATGFVTIDTQGSDFVTTMSVYTGSSLTALGLIAQSNTTGALSAAAVTFNAVAGTTYRIVVDGASGTALPFGNINLSFT